MAFLKPPKEEVEIKKLSLKQLRDEYLKTAENYNKLLEGDYLYCHGCNTFLSRKKAFYSDKSNASGCFPICKDCLLKMAEQRKKNTDTPNETKESVKHVLQIMDKPYYDSVYDDIYKAVKDDTGERSVTSPFLRYITTISSFPQYRDKHWKDGDFEVEQASVNPDKIKQSTIKRFGSGLSNEDYMFLQNQYEDWVTRYECKTKAQEELFERLCFKKLEIFKATREGKPTKDLDESYQKLMNTANITPKQNSLDNLSEAQTFGTLIQKYENERPLPEIDPDLRDVDRIGTYIEVFFKGHMAKMLDLKNNMSHIYENYMKKYTVNKTEYQEDSDSEELFASIFGDEV